MFAIQENSLKIITEILGKYAKIKRRVDFGSRATAKYRDNSDVDIALFGADITFEEISKIIGEMDESDLVYKVDIVHYESLNNKELKENIDREGVEF